MLDPCVDFPQIAAWRPDRGLNNYKLFARSVLDDIPHSKLIAESSLVRQVDSPLEDSAFVAMLVGQCGGAVDLRRCVLKLF
jgi:hypothetical protein